MALCQSTFGQQPSIIKQDPTDLHFTFATAVDEPTLTAIVGMVPDAEPSTPRYRTDGSTYTTSKPSSYGMEMNDRDFRVSTAVLTNAFEDLKYNPTTKKEENWGELSLEGVYKDDGAGNMIHCTDDVDAALNAVLSIFDFCAKSQGVLVQYEMRDGILYVDPNIFSNPVAPTFEERFGHRAYAIVAPAIPAAIGGSIQVFDGYLGGTPDLKVTALSPQATILNPNTPAGAAGTLLRLAIFYPKNKPLHHVLRIVMYRAPGTF